MSRHRFIVDIESDGEVPENIDLTESRQIHQIRKVLRLSTGDRLDLIDGRGMLFTCSIESIEKTCVKLKVLETATEPPPQRPAVHMICAMIKNDKFELIVQKLTELGVDRITPVHCRRSVVNMAPDQPESEFKDSNKYQRWLSIRNEATEQSERYRPPRIDSPENLEHFLMHLAEEDRAMEKDENRLIRALSFICDAREVAPPLVEQICREKSINASRTIPLSHIRIVIGPEGGFTQSEIDMASAAGFTPCNLGLTILRSETAAIAAATIATSFGDFL
ncbi:MAG: 16S rRNA (uracil(1498)-N(3))-methyltransferase [Candidatus Obscuribacterales bacterium]|nr:16S rRNA (uracil(1498)-N(3))-methyltransferase [Candidatus Obscuribacterales bacterium]